MRSIKPPLAAAALLCAVAAIAEPAADTWEGREAQLPLVVVTDSRTDLKDVLSPGVVSVAYPDDVKGEHKSIPDLLDQIPGVYRDISFDSSGNAYVLMGTYDSSWNLVGKLVKVTAFSPLASTDIDIFSTAPGYFWSAQYTADNNRIWFARGNAIRVYDASSFTTPAASLTLTANNPSTNPGGLIDTGNLYDNLNDLTYIGAAGARTALRGYRSPVQASHTPRAQAARAIARGRPELTGEEWLAVEAAAARP